MSNRSVLPTAAQDRVLTTRRRTCRLLSFFVEVTALEPGARFAFTVASGPFKARNNYTFASVGGGTIVTDAAEIELSGSIRLVDP